MASSVTQQNIVLGITIDVFISTRQITYTLDLSIKSGTKPASMHYCKHFCVVYNWYHKLTYITVIYSVTQ